MQFEIKDRDASGRVCKFTTKHGTVTTPTLLPVINPNKMLLTPKEMKKLFQTEMIITNSYIIYKDKNIKKQALNKGLHKLVDFNGPIMTDSGTFQSYVYGDIKLDPIEIVEFQRDIKTDVGTILDVFGIPDQTKTQAENGMKETIKRAKKSVKVKKDLNLACTVQGSIYPDLRTKCAQELSKIDADFYPIGGVVPLMQNQRYSDLVRVIIASKKGLNPSKPVHLFGAGHPLIFPLAVALGCDFFDSSAYVKYANDDRLIFPWGTEKLDDVEELPCSCPICSTHTAAELKKLNKNQRILQIAKHNLYISFAEIKKIRNTIKQGTLWELVERRANSNPHLLNAMKVLREKEYKNWLERFEPTHKNKAMFYTGNHTIHRPIIHRVHKKLKENYKPVFKNLVVLPEGKKPYSVFYSKEIKKLQIKNADIIIDSHLGPVPIELDEMYPFAQSVFPNEVDIETENYVKDFFTSFTKKYNVVFWKRNETLKKLSQSETKPVDFDISRISAVVDMQFGVGASKALLNGEISLVKSKKTHKIRNVLVDGVHVLSMRADDGMFTLKINGGKTLHKSLKKPRLRVVVDKDAASFIKEGKSAFAKFVKDCDGNLRPFDECIIVDEKDSLLACGRTLLNKEEMLAFNTGIAVKTREHI